MIWGAAGRCKLGSQLLEKDADAGQRNGKENSKWSVFHQKQLENWKLCGGGALGAKLNCCSRKNCFSSSQLRHKRQTLN